MSDPTDLSDKSDRAGDGAMSEAATDHWKERTGNREQGSKKECGDILTTDH